MKYWVGVSVGVLLGIVLLLSGIGKLFMGVPAQLDFIQSLAPIFGIASNAIAFVVPWIEIIAGLLLVLQVFPSFVSAILCIPLTIGFGVNNVWMLTSGLNYEHCNSCFGTLNISMTPWQALIFDLVLMIMALTVIYINTHYKLLWGLIK